MISVTATEFQQRTGYYFDLAEKGEEIEIRKMKPKGQVFKLIRRNKLKIATKKRPLPLIHELEKIMSEERVEDALKFQNKVRS